MELSKALHILAEAHTREDHAAGFTVQGHVGGSYFDRYTQAEYIEAWRTVRLTLHLPVDPAAPQG
jgi:hypothetical protein